MRKSIKSIMALVGAVVILVIGILVFHAEATPLAAVTNNPLGMSPSIVTTVDDIKDVAAVCGEESADSAFCEPKNVLSCIKGSIPNKPECLCVPCPPPGAHCPCPAGRTCNIGGKWYKC